MTTYEEFQNRFNELQKDINAKGSTETYQAAYLLVESLKLIGDLLKEFKLLEDNLEWKKKVEATEWGR